MFITDYLRARSESAKINLTKIMIKRKTKGKTHKANAWHLRMRQKVKILRGTMVIFHQILKMIPMRIKKNKSGQQKNKKNQKKPLNKRLLVIGIKTTSTIRNGLKGKRTLEK